jgi:hypothetical protein
MRLASRSSVRGFRQADHECRPAHRPDAVLASVARIGAITRDVLRCAAATGTTALSIADAIVRARIRRANGARALIR